MYKIMLSFLLIATPLIAADTTPNGLPKNGSQKIKSDKKNKRKKKYLGIVARGAGRIIPRRASYVRV